MPKKVKDSQEHNVGGTIFSLADDYKEEYEEAKVTLAEEEKVEYNLGEGEAKESVALAQPYSRKKRHKLVRSGEAEQILPTAYQPGLLIRRLKRNA